ncbi:aminoacyl-histidine dipeptidase [Alkalitalea saponilacus]|uniref:Cytosol non-specific dipeptidase n=1 Tax=Alkalitalea saponilacus TaxID=889453 RepID=A0A1T5CL85_9BACT|nr:aminoacyl-histidine dipeptidase [Alkalitalea saponilacus]ASB49901.1 beta-Ala-His dipeptidase [Alkalitalea saponilacus]SKB60106.1 dipeptidase D [Alkalitalea saponilacus]
MTHPLKSLKPDKLWEQFYNLTTIPRPSKKEEKVVEYVKNFGEKLGLETIVDEVGNVIIRKPATAGFEDRKGVILQSHLDMVPQKNSDNNHNFETDPIETYIENGWVKARGTTLGADNGIGVAAILAVLASDDLQHGPVEGLFTIDEEAGMTGAHRLKPGLLNGEILLNLDSEDEGELYVGCAGGTNANMIFSFREEPVPDDHVAFRISLTGLKGGHSGLDINRGRANANKLLFRFIKHAVIHLGARLADVDGGSLRNAIPREAFAVLTVPKEEVVEFVEEVHNFEVQFCQEYNTSEPDILFKIEETDIPAFVIEEIVQDDLINAIQACPNGVIRMSADMEGLVETSLNLAIVKTEGHEVKALALLRSSVESTKEDLESSLESLFRLAGAEIWFDGHYPGWKPNLQSGILKTMQEVYNQKWGVTPEIKAIHAGLECGILGSAYPHWDMISFGPTIRFPHSPDEKVDIASVEKFWEYLAAMLKEAGK